MSSDDRAAMDAADLTDALLHTNTVEPFAHIGETQLSALRKLLRSPEQIWCTSRGGKDITSTDCMG